MTSQGAFIEMELPCTLTDEEIQSRGRMLGETIWTIDDVSTARTAAMKEFKDRLTGLNETQRKLATTIGTRMEKRMVRCAVLFHMPGEGLKRIVRADTGEMVREEDMTASEKQLNLFAAQRDFEKFMESQGGGDAPDAEDPPAMEPPGLAD